MLCTRYLSGFYCLLIFVLSHISYIIIISLKLIAALKGLGLLVNDTESPRIEAIIKLLWQDARLDKEIKTDIEQHNGQDVECSIKLDDEIELGLLKLALFGVSLNQRAKFCMPCGSSSKPRYDNMSWVLKSKLRRTNGELVRHDAMTCLACRDVSMTCPYSKRDSTLS